MAAFAFEIEDGVDHVLDDARTGDLPVLGDVADEDHGGAGLLGVADQGLRRGAHLGHRAGRGIGHVGPQRLDRVDDDEGRRLAVAEGGEDVLDAGFGREQHRRVGEPEPRGAEPDLGDRLLAGNIDDRGAPARQRAGGLQEQRRLADARVAADEQRRTAHESAAGDSVELADAGHRPAGLRGSRPPTAQERRPCPSGRSAPARRRRRPTPTSSTRVFHSPQSSHFPCQRGLTAPQFWQTKVDLSRAATIPSVAPRFRCSFYVL